MHMAWLRSIGGRLESRYRYSIGLVYNPFPWPSVGAEAQIPLTKLAHDIFRLREKYNDSTLGDIYDPIATPIDLRKAHQALDEAVDKLYRKEPFCTDRERVEFLLARYEALRSPLIPQPKPPRGGGGY